MDSTEKFTGLAEVYEQGRPTYANACLDALYTQYGFSPDAVIADVGCGTGKFARQLLARGSFVYGVEPNADMRRLAAQSLSGCDRFLAINGSAEDTTLPAASVDFITAAQAFHWFDGKSFQRECRRILKPSGKVLLLWNTRDMTDPLVQKSFAIFQAYCPDFKGFSGGMKQDDDRIQAFFAGGYQKLVYENPLTYDKEQFLKRSLSSSYSLKLQDENYPAYLAELAGLFSAFEADGKVVMGNQTVAYLGTVGESGS